MYTSKVAVALLFLPLVAMAADESPGLGDRDTIHSALPVKTVGSYWPYATTVFDYIRRAMPYTAPGSLSNDEVYALTAFLLFKNDIVDEDVVLDAQSLPKVRMPNRDNFDWAWQP